MSAVSPRGLWIVTGLLLGLAIGALVPPLPLHAVATHSDEGFAICTAELFDGHEGIYFLDSRTGYLRALFLNPNNSKFTSFYEYKVLDDFNKPMSPKFLLVSGRSQLRATGNVKPSVGVVYVVETNSGIVNAYVAPYAPNHFSLNAPNTGTLIKLDTGKFVGQAVRPSK
ncbi:MAG: hypothetical protein SFX18_04630 [Pirellulales bacterium]|nr:hypothetical protein [Pirellulales bacterium]